MTRLPDPGFEPRIAGWLEADPDQAPREVLVTVLAAYPSIPQRHAPRVPWRFQPMNRFVSMGAAAAIVVAVSLGGVLLASRGSGPGVGTQPPTPAPTATSAPPPVWPLIPDGTYLGPEQPVADILAQLDADLSLSDTNRAAIADTILGIRGATTYQTKIELHGSSMIVSSGVDGVFAPEGWSIRSAGGDLLVASGSSSAIAFRVGGCDGTRDPCSFTLRATEPATSAIESFVRRITFETGPFEPQP